MANQRVPGSLNGVSQAALRSEMLCRVPSYNPKSVGTTDVSAWRLEDRFINVLQRTGPKLPDEIREEFMALLQPQALAMIVAVLVVWAASHAFGIGFVADVILLAVGAAFLGYQIWSVADDFAEFMKKTYYAKTDTDLEQASRHLANFIAVVGVAAFLAVLSRGAKGAGNKLSSIKLKPTVTRDYYMRILGWAHKPKGITDRLDTAVSFLTRNWQKLREHEKGLTQETMDGFIRGIDFSQTVHTRRLTSNSKFRDLFPGEFNKAIPGDPDAKIRLIQYTTGNYQTNFFTIPGTSAGNLGIPRFDARIHRVYEIVGNVEVLVSKTAPMGKNVGSGGLGLRLSGEFSSGGGYQIIIPSPASNLKRLQIDGKTDKSLWTP